MDTLQSRISAGAKFLDRHFGHIRWAEKIDLQTLAINSTCNCVCAQLGGEIYSMPSPNYPECNILAYDMKFGFMVGIREDIAALAAWKDEIRRRLETLNAS